MGTTAHASPGRHRLMPPEAEEVVSRDHPWRLAPYQPSAVVARPLRFVNLPFGLWLVAAPWFLHGATTERPLRPRGTMPSPVFLCSALPCRVVGEARSTHGPWDQYVV